MKTSEEFNLSEKIYGGRNGFDYVIEKNDVKEFIRLLKDEISDGCSGEHKTIHDRIIDKLAGEKLI